MKNYCWLIFFLFLITNRSNCQIKEREVKIPFCPSSFTPWQDRDACGGRAYFQLETGKRYRVVLDVGKGVNVGVGGADIPLENTVHIGMGVKKKCKYSKNFSSWVTGFKRVDYVIDLRSDDSDCEIEVRFGTIAVAGADGYIRIYEEE